MLQAECTFFGVTFLFQSAKTKRGARKLPATVPQKRLRWLQRVGNRLPRPDPRSSFRADVATELELHEAEISGTSSALLHSLAD